MQRLTSILVGVLLLITPISGAAGPVRRGDRLQPPQETQTAPTLPQTERDAGILTGRPSVRATRTTAPPLIDGRLDDVVWIDAARIDAFVQRRPLDGAPATEATEVYVAYDRHNLYFGMYVHYSDAGLIRANRSDRDQTSDDDTVALYFDPFVDQQRAYVFSVNGYGVQADSIMNARGRWVRRRRRWRRS